MAKILQNIGFFINKLFPVILIVCSLLIYRELVEENKRLNDKIESLTSLISYKTAELKSLIVGDSTNQK